MAIGATLIGGLVGGALGTVAHVALETQTALDDAPWFALVTGLTTGLGARLLNGRQQMRHTSYLRAALTALIALAAIVLSPQVKAVIVQRQNDVVASKPAPMPQPAENDADVARDAAGNAATDEPRADREGLSLPDGMDTGMGRIGMQREFDAMQFLFIALGTLLAYELARGSSRKSEPSAETAPGAAPGSSSEPAGE